MGLQVRSLQEFRRCSEGWQVHLKKPVASGFAAKAIVRLFHKPVPKLVLATL